MLNEITNGLHYSETALDNYDQWDNIIMNNGILEDLYNHAKAFVNIHKLE